MDICRMEWNQNEQTFSEREEDKYSGRRGSSNNDDDIDDDGDGDGDVLKKRAI